MVQFLYALIKALPAARDMFFGLQKLYYDDLFAKLSDERDDYVGRRRALSNAIENANSNDDLAHLSILLAELQTAGHRKGAEQAPDAAVVSERDGE